MRERSGSAHSDSDNSSGVDRATGSRDNGTCAGQSGEEAARGKGKLHQDKSARAATRAKKELRETGSTGDKSELQKTTAARGGRTPPTIAVKGIRRTTEDTTEQGQSKASSEEETSKGANDDNGEATETSSESEEMQTKLGAGTCEVQQEKTDSSGANEVAKKETPKPAASDRDKPEEKVQGTAGSGEGTAPTTIDLTEDSDGEAEIVSGPPPPASTATSKHLSFPL